MTFRGYTPIFTLDEIIKLCKNGGCVAVACFLLMDRLALIDMSDIPGVHLPDCIMRK